MPIIIPGNRLASTGYAIDQSIRFNDDDSAYMSRTLSASNRKTFTFSCWVKRGNLSSYQRIFNAYDSSDDEHLIFRNTDVLHFYSGDASADVKTNQVFRDISAWYNIVCTVDTTNAVSSERVRLYVNGSRVTSLATATYPSLNADTGFNENVAHHIGVSSASSQYLDGYLADIVFIDGTALDPSSFGEYSDDGIWRPKDVSGLTFGTNGFYIDGRDASDLGDDESGNGNDFTTSGLASDDQMPDTPTNNQITFNPLNNQRSGGTPKNGNLEYSGPGTRTMISLTAAIPSSGKWAVAFKTDTVSTDAGFNFGINLMTNSNYGDAAGSNEDFGNPLGLHGYPSTSDLYFSYYDGGGVGVTPSPLIDLATDDELWCAIDMDTGKAWIGLYNKSGSSFIWIAEDGGNDGDPATGANPGHTFSDFIGNSDVTFGAAVKQSSITLTLLRESDCEGTTPTGFTYFENVKDLI